MMNSEPVWLLYEHGDLRGVYATEETARADAAALVERADGESGRPVSRYAIEVIPAPVRTNTRWAGRA